MFVRTGLPPIRQLPGNEIDHLLDATRCGTPDLWRLTWHFRGECSGSTTGFHTLNVLFREISLRHRPQHFLRWTDGSNVLHERYALCPRLVGCLCKHRFTGFEVCVETSVRQPSILHDVGHASAVVAASSNCARSGPDNALVGDFFGSWGRFFHMTVNIFECSVRCKQVFRTVRTTSSLCRNDVRVDVQDVSGHLDWAAATPY